MPQTAKHTRLGYPYDLRPMESTDQGHIVSNWFQNVRDKHNGFFGARHMDKAAYGYYVQHQNRIIEKLLDSAIVRILCAHDYSDQIMGWACADQRDGQLLLHYVFVKEIYRGKGFARALVESLRRDNQTLSTTHWNRVCTSWNKRFQKEDRDSPDRLNFNPHYLYEV